MVTAAWDWRGPAGVRGRGSAVCLPTDPAGRPRLRRARVRGGGGGVKPGSLAAKASSSKDLRANPLDHPRPERYSSRKANVRSGTWKPHRRVASPRGDRAPFPPRGRPGERWGSGTDALSDMGRTNTTIRGRHATPANETSWSKPRRRTKPNNRLRREVPDPIVEQAETNRS